MDATPDILTGKTMAHVAPFDSPTCLIHALMVEPFRRLVGAAARAGFEIKIVSAFRDFQGQLHIWNEKATGKRAILDSASQPIDASRLTPEERVLAILRWSALPGASRHHWGTDVDIVDAKAIPPGYRVQLVPEEVEGNGFFAPLHDWLDLHMGEHGFFRPYAEDRGGVSPERWHISYEPVARAYYDSYTLELMESVIRTAPIALKDAILMNSQSLYRRFVRNITQPSGKM